MFDSLESYLASLRKTGPKKEKLTDECMEAEKNAEHAPSN